MELTQLKYFAEAAKTENLSKAAQNLHISQPSLTKAIRKLEEELNTPLFDRLGRRVVLNSEGRAFFARIRPILTEVETVSESFRELSRRRERIVVGVWGSSNLLTGCVREFMEQNPDVAVEIKSGIENTRIDISDFDALLYSGNDESYKEYRGFRVAKERYVLAVHRSSDMGDAAFAEASDVEKLRFIRLEPDKELDALCRRAGVILHTAALVDSLIMQKEFVSAGIGECVLPESESGIFADDPNIHLAHIWDDDFCRDMNVCFKREKLLSSGGLRFRSFVLDYFGIRE